MPALEARPAASYWRRLQRNALAAFPPEAFEEEVVRRRIRSREQIILSRPDGIRRVLVDRPENYVRTALTGRILYPLLGNGLFLATDADWRRQRRTVAPAFGPRIVPMFAAGVGEVAQETVAGLAGRIAEPVDLLAEMQALALEVAGRSLLSYPMRSQGPRLRALIRGYAAGLGRPSLLDFFLPGGVPSPRDLRRSLFRQRWMRLVRGIVAERRTRGQAGDGDLFDLLAGAARSPRELADQIATMIVAGHETTAIALFWSLFVLAGEPAAQAAIASEAAALDLGREGAAAALDRLPYTRAVVQEAMRLYPPAFTIVRQALAADRIGEVEIPARGVVMIAPWVLHRHRRLWAEPDRFDPGRFLPGAPPPDRFAYLPFGIGPRICIGAQFAMTEAVLVLAAVVRAFAIERAGNEAVTPTAIVLTQPDPPPLFRLRPR